MSEASVKTIRKKNRGLKITIILLFAGGICVLLYPVACNIHNQYINDRIIEKYSETTEKLSSEQYKEIWDKAESYNRNHKINVVVDVFGDSKAEKNEEYESLLNPGNSGIMGFLEIPKIKVRLAIYHGIDDKGLELGCGHIQGTSLPVGGSSTHCVLAAHRGLPTAKLFTDLDQMEQGDLVYVHIMDQTLSYETDQIKTVKPDELDDLAIYEGKDLFTLLTCTPYGVNSHRLLVRGHRVPYVPQNESNPVFKYMTVLLAVTALLLVVDVLLLYILKKRRR